MRLRHIGIVEVLVLHWRVSKTAAIVTTVRRQAWIHLDRTNGLLPVEVNGGRVSDTRRYQDLGIRDVVIPGLHMLKIGCSIWIRGRVKESNLGVRFIWHAARAL